MKKFVRLLSAALVLCMLVVMMVSCGGPSGTYASASVASTGVEYTFSGKKVTVTATVLGFEKSFEGTFEMGKKTDDEGNTVKTITITLADAEDYAGTFTYESGKDDTGAYIALEGVKYYKQ